MDTKTRSPKGDNLTVKEKKGLKVFFKWENNIRICLMAIKARNH